MDYIETSYNALSEIYVRGAYLDAALAKVDLSGAATKIIYGVLEKDVQLEYIISDLVKQKPKSSVLVLLKIGAYCLTYMDSLPDYAVVNGVVEFAKKIGKSGVSGFINAILKKIATKHFNVPSDEINKISFDTSKPVWFVKRILKEYGKEVGGRILSEPPFELEHIRNNPKICSALQLKTKLQNENTEYIDSSVGGFSVRNCQAVKSMFFDGAITIQSPSSMFAVQVLKPYGEVLDLCAAPGGKSVYAAQYNRNCTVTACDLNDSKIKQIKSYCKRMTADNVSVQINDATKLNENFIGKFDCVLVDAPCSCFGTYRKHPDVFLRHDESVIKQISATQKKILDNAVLYLKRGGTLVYSTCTLFNEENIENVEYVLKKPSIVNNKIEEYDLPQNLPHIEKNGTITVLPFKEWDGFFVAKFKKL